MDGAGFGGGSTKSSCVHRPEEPEVVDSGSDASSQNQLKRIKHGKGNTYTSFSEVIDLP